MKHKLIIFDVDGTLRTCNIPGQPCPNKPGEWDIMPGVVERIATIDRYHFKYGGVKLGIASNQGGVGLGYMSELVAEKMIYDAARVAFGVNPNENYVQVCFHRPDAGCQCRKPNPGMLIEIMRKARISNDLTLYVGDRKEDEQAAANAHVDFMYANKFFNFFNFKGYDYDVDMP